MDIKIQKCASDYFTNGFGVIEDFLTPNEVESLKCEIEQLSKKKINDINTGKDACVDATMNKRFLNTCDKIEFFYEKYANKNESNNDFSDEKRKQLFAKIGHGLHAYSEPFKRITTSDKIKKLFKAINFADPVVVQGMVIFKNKQVGGEYFAHQDATFLITKPVIAVAGIWFALDDATQENGCLEFSPKSHCEPVVRKLVRKVPNIESLDENDPAMVFIGSQEEKEKFADKKFVPVPAKSGTLVLIHGQVLHKSNPNASDKSRLAYTFHAYDASKVQWSDENWISPNSKALLHVNTSQLHHIM